MGDRKYDWNSYGEALRSLREAHGMTLEELRRMLGVSRSAVQRWESETLAVPREEIILKTEKIFGLPIGTLARFKAPKERGRLVAIQQTYQILRRLPIEQVEEIRRQVMRMDLERHPERTPHVIAHATS